MEEKKEKKRGAPTKPDEEKVNSKGLFVRQWKRIQTEAKARGIPASIHLRHIVDRYFEIDDMAKHQEKEK